MILDGCKFAVHSVVAEPDGRSLQWSHDMLEPGRLRWRERASGAAGRGNCGQADDGEKEMTAFQRESMQ